LDLVKAKMQWLLDAVDTGQLEIAGGKQNEQAFGSLFGIKSGPSKLQKKGSTVRRIR
jgi:hypothetical protein